MHRLGNEPAGKPAAGMIAHPTFVVLLLLALPALAQEGRRVAVTLDDGPVVNTGQDLATFRRVSAGLIESLKSENVPATIFLNERQLNVQGQRDARAAVVAQWLDAGFDLGNHTYSHPSLNRVALWTFQDDVVRGDVIMRALLRERGRDLVWFRYPFLHSGTTAEVHQGIMDFLEQRKYRVAPVTVDYEDYTFAGLYTRLLRAGDSATAEKVKEAYLEHVDVGFDYAEKLSKELFGYEPPQILLLHCNELNSVTLRDSIARMRKRGYSFITLDEAMKDAAYQRPDTFTGPGGSWLSRTSASKGKPIDPRSEPDVPAWVWKLIRPAAVK